MSDEAPVVDVVALSEWLADARPPVVVDVRWSLGGPPGDAAYLRGHLPGALFADLDRVFCAPPGPGGRHPLPAAADFQRAMRDLGVSGDTAVVVYDAGDMLPAARAWWTLRYFGQATVRVLDGGYQAWQAARLPVEAGQPAGARTGDHQRYPARPGDFVARPGGMPTLDAQGAAELAGTGILIDVRAPQRYAAESEPIDPVAGHIPGAVNLPSGEDLAPGGGLRAAGELADRYAELPGEVGAYCGSGITAARTVLALAVAGRPAALYPGSWSNWITDPSRPVAVGDR